MSIIEKYGLEILRFTTNQDLQELLGGPDRPDSETLAKAIMFQSKTLQTIILNHLNRFRRHAVEQFLANNTENAHDNWSGVAQYCEQKILTTIAKHHAAGSLVLTLDDDNASRLDRDTESQLSPPELLQRPSWPWLNTLAEFNLQTASFKDILDYWLPVADHTRKSGILSLDGLYDKLQDQYSRFVLQLFLDDCPKDMVVELAGQKHDMVLTKLTWRLDVIQICMTGLNEGINPDWLLKRFETMLVENTGTDELHNRCQTLAQMCTQYKPELPLIINNDVDLLAVLVGLVHRSRMYGNLALEGIEYTGTIDHNLLEYIVMAIAFIADSHEPSFVQGVMKVRAQHLHHWMSAKMQLFTTLIQLLQRQVSPFFVRDFIRAYSVDENEFLRFSISDKFD